VSARATWRFFRLFGPSPPGRGRSDSWSNTWLRFAQKSTWKRKSRAASFEVGDEGVGGERVAHPAQASAESSTTTEKDGNGERVRLAS
jgi:hypothetical protein